VSPENQKADDEVCGAAAGFDGSSVDKPRSDAVLETQGDEMIERRRR